MSDNGLTYERELLPAAVVAGDDQPTFAAEVRAVVLAAVENARGAFSYCQPIMPTFPALRWEARWCASEAEMRAARSDKAGVSAEQAERLRAAAAVLLISATILDRLDNVRPRMRRDDLAELLFLGARLAQMDLELRGHIDGRWALIQRGRADLERRRAGGKAAAKKRVGEWEPEAKRLLKAAYEGQPWLSNDALAAEHLAPTLEDGPGVRQLSLWVGKMRRATPPVIGPRVPKPSHGGR